MKRRVDRAAPTSRAASATGAATMASVTAYATGRSRRADDTLCSSCRLNEVIPNLSVEGAVEAWHRLEIAKRRLLYTLFELGLPVEARRDAIRTGSVLRSVRSGRTEAKVFTGHADGLITINIAEADDPFRETSAQAAGRDLPHAARPLPPRDRPLLLGSAGRATARAASRSARCSATSAPTTPRRIAAPLRAGRARRLAAALRQRLRDDASVGGLGRDLGALPAHGRHARDRAQLRPAALAGRRPRRRRAP